jgi:hypothetical protein
LLIRAGISRVPLARQRSAAADRPAAIAKNDSAERGDLDHTNDLVATAAARLARA